MDKLKLLALGQDFIINKKNEGYTINDKKSNLEAFIKNDKKIKYYISGVYNSGVDYVEIDVERLSKLKEFCEMMIK